MQAQGSQLTNKYAEGYRASVTTAAVNTSTWLNSWQSTARKNCSALTMLTSSHLRLQAFAVYTALLQPATPCSV